MKKLKQKKIIELTIYENELKRLKSLPDTEKNSRDISDLKSLILDISVFIALQCIALRAKKIISLFFW